jgi:hypothetical protein
MRVKTSRPVWRGVLVLAVFVAVVAIGLPLLSAFGPAPGQASPAGPTPSAGTPRFPDAHESPPSGWTGPVFRLSQDYPVSQPSPEAKPWKQYDFRSEPDKYMRAVLDYVCEGNVEVDWVVQNNPKRRWYHAPWMHYGDSGREFVHGMTRERTSRPKELAPTQTTSFQNWAVGFYNPSGGYALGEVWKNATAPDVSKARFPDGTVGAKLLFTEASVAEVPFLKESKEWDANIVKAPSNPKVREVRKVRLLQLDIGIRDDRADATTGWVFGTFVYEGSAAGDTPYRRMVPVGLMWGNDPGVTPDQVAAGTKLKETWINPSLQQPHNGFVIRVAGPGWAGRANGPVDNPASSCLSCHSTAQIPTASGMTPGNETDINKILRWFRNIKAAEAFDPGQAVSADYSLQVSSGILNLKLAQASPPPPPPPPGAAPAHGARARTLSPAMAGFGGPGAADVETVVIDGRVYHKVSREE